MPRDYTAVTVTFIAYLALMLAIGWFAWRRTRDLADYILGGRRLGRWVAALSAGASDMSGWLLLGLPGFAYAAGLEAGWLALGLLVGTWANWRWIARPLRAYTEAAGNALTLPAFFAQRCGGRGAAVRVVAALVILLFFAIYTASGLVAGGKLFQTVFGIPYGAAVLAGAAAVLLYTLFGGFLAVSWTDVVQALLMAAALAVVPAMAWFATGGAMLGAIEARGAGLLNPLTDADGQPLSLIAVASLLAWGLGYFGQPHILARFMAISSPDQVPRARRIAVGWTALTLLGATLVGLSGIAYLAEPLHGAGTERVFMLLTTALFHPVIAGILLAAILAAIMSTADSQLLVSSSALAEDFYRALLRRQASQGELVAVQRGAVLAVALVATVLAMDPDSRVLALVAYAWAGFGAAFGPVVILALFWERLNASGALAAMLSGGVTVLVWGRLEGGWFDLYELVPGFVAAMAAGVVGSLATAPVAADIRQRHRALRQRLSAGPR